MKTNRILYVDVIKVFLTCLVVAHHAGQAYGPTGGVWVFSDSSKADWLGNFFFINASYMMGLYFFISGYFMVFSLKRKTTTQFIQDRLVRLGIPFLFFTLFIFLPFNFIGDQSGKNILEVFVETYFNKPPIATGHLWFVASLLVYSIIYILAFKQNNDSPKNIPFKQYYIFIYIIGLTIISALVRLYYPIDTWKTWIIPVEVAHIPQYFSLFIIGTMFNHYQWLESFKIKTGMYFFIIAILSYFTNDYLPENIKDFWLTESFIESFLCVGISMSMLTVFRHYANKNNKVIQLLSDNAFGIYLFHVLVVIGLQAALLDININVNIKFALVTVGGIMISLLISHWLRKIKQIRSII